MATRPLDSMQYEGSRGALSSAGVRVVAKGLAQPGAGAEAAYTVVGPKTRRCLIIHKGAATPALGDILFAYNATADANSFPIVHGEYFRVDAAKDDSLSFWNTTGSSINVYVLEVE